MGTLSMTASDLHTKDHRPPERSCELSGDGCAALLLVMLAGNDLLSAL